MAKMTREAQREVRIAILDNYSVGGSGWMQYSYEEAIAIWGSYDNMPAFMQRHFATDRHQKREQ